MSFNVRLYGHGGLKQMKVLQSHQFASDAIYQLDQPYLWNQTLVTNGATAVSSTPATLPAGQTLDATDILRIEIPDGCAIRYEVNPPTRSVAASVNSPLIEGKVQIKFGQGWTISIIDASAVSA